MTVNRISATSDVNRRSLWAIALIATFAIAAFWLTRPVTGAQSLSPVSGLMTLKASAQTATPYETAIANGKPTLIEFYADWCTTCQGMAPTLQAIHQDYGAALNFVMLDIDDPQWREQVQQFNVTGVPHLVLRQSDGAITETFVGKVPKSVLVERLQPLL
ncbi:thioredoxin domain-containing protein [Leptolyngbya iicbica]|uniref:Thiol:disulfide interchange protein n=2 Tax=Cyanophyceae TaxID=3028117 RepID=A0A4Q7EDY2_9CYAN|nr:thioredoxin domain-containing protein [Leptolyngbya sp. LK]RZM82004.1 thiol:disulfide interchange protein [Leptolyngbya sp. LK]